MTVQNNILASLALILGALVLASGKRSKGVEAFRAFATLFMVVVGVGFAILLAGLQGVALTAVPWDNTVLHYIIPVAIVVDFLIDPPKLRFKFGRTLVWLTYPVAYLVYTMVRGSITGWYPYPFLNPAKTSSVELISTIAALLVLGVLLTWALAAYSKRRS